MWAQIEASWTQLKDKFALMPFRLSADGYESLDPIRAERSRVGQSDELQPAAFRPDGRGMRSAFSLHIGC
jgi:hypothetical protein